MVARRCLNRLAATVLRAVGVSLDFWRLGYAARLATVGGREGFEGLALVD